VSCRVCYSRRVTETLTIRLPKSLAREFRAKTRAAKTNPTEVLRQAAASYVRNDPTARNAIVEHIRARAGTWDGDISGEELLRRTRP
jgi:Ribbon-helix-helix protein, copG family